MAVERVFYYREGDPNTQFANFTQTFGDFFGDFSIEASGVNEYYGFDERNLAPMRAFNAQTGIGQFALNQRHLFTFRDALARLAQPHVREKTVVLGIEPTQRQANAANGVPVFDPVASYGYVIENQWAVERLAQEINRIQSAAPPEKELRVVLRFASEMNLGAGPSFGAAYGRPSGNGTGIVQAQNAQETAFKSALRAMRSVFHTHAPRVAFSFSPGLFAGVALEPLPDYWPEVQGDPARVIDIVGGTWYARDDVAAQGQPATNVFPQAFQSLQGYFRMFAPAQIGAARAYALDEIGGGLGPRTALRQSEQYLNRMFDALVALPLPLDYVTLFINRNGGLGRGVWGNGVLLSFLHQ